MHSRHAAEALDRKLAAVAALAEIAARRAALSEEVDR